MECPGTQHAKACSSSSSSSEKDLFQLDASDLSKPMAHKDNRKQSDPNHRGDAQLATQSNAGNGISSVSQQSDPMLMESALLPNAVGLTQSPPNQVMGKSNETDKYRIPSSVFERSKSTTPMEWSVASNESLFSIHMGNSSFSRDHVFLLGRSGELSNPSNPTGPFLPSQNLSGPGNENMVRRESTEQPGATQVANAETMKEVLRAAADEHTKDSLAQTNDNEKRISASRPSDGSTTSTQSFAFPILTEGRSNSVNVNNERGTEQPQKQEPLKQEQEATPNPPASKWFPCFPCCNFCS